MESRRQSKYTSPVSLDEQLANGVLSLRRLSLRRQLNEIRLERQRDNQDQEKLVKSYKNRMAAATKRFQAIMIGTCDIRSEYIRIAQEHYTKDCGDYVVRKHAQLLHLGRSQPILEAYISMTQQQYGNMIEVLREIHHDMLYDLHTQKSQHKEQQCQIQKQLVTMVTAKVMSYCTSTVASSLQIKPSPILVQRLMKRKGIGRGFVLTSVV